jgi:hypothetical protein
VYTYNISKTPNQASDLAISNNGKVGVVSLQTAEESGQ